MRIVVQSATPLKRAFPTPVAMVVQSKRVVAHCAVQSFWQCHETMHLTRTVCGIELGSGSVQGAK
ncbi:MAG: hypothetical protein DRP63_08340 [Planctomycetota bacterium]|nr:MAG: hypothetical protein DRP63_08340 [Planctomycetota bacterium]